MKINFSFNSWLLLKINNDITSLIPICLLHLELIWTKRRGMEAPLSIVVGLLVKFLVWCKILIFPRSDSLKVFAACISLTNMPLILGTSSHWETGLLHRSELESSKRRNKVCSGYRCQFQNQERQDFFACKLILHSLATVEKKSRDPSTQVMKPPLLFLQRQRGNLAPCRCLDTSECFYPALSLFQDQKILMNLILFQL